MGRFAKYRIAGFILGLAPLAWGIYRVFAGKLGADPAKELVDYLGFWALIILLVCLALTPLRLITGSPAWVALRRMAGLYAFFYAACHLLAYMVILFELQWARLLEELLKRPYIILGSLAFTLMIPLAVTSTKNWRRRLGARWQRLHRLVYPVATLAVLHQVWVQKSDYTESVMFAIFLGVLFSIRIAYKTGLARASFRHLG